MVLTIMERLLLVNLFPLDGKKIAHQQAVLVIKNKAGLTAKELLKYDVHQEDGNTIWDLEKPQENEIDFSNADISMIVEELKEQDEATPPQLTANHVTLYEKFVEG